MRGKVGERGVAEERKREGGVERRNVERKQRREE